MEGKIILASSSIIALGLITVASIKEGIKYKEHKDAIKMMEDEKKRKDDAERAEYDRKQREKREAEKKELYATFSVDQKFELEKLNKQKEIELLKTRSAEKIAYEERMAAEKAAESERRAKQDILDAELLMKRYESDVEKAKYGAISGGVVGAFNAFGRSKNDDKGE